MAQKNIDGWSYDYEVLGPRLIRRKGGGPVTVGGYDSIQFNDGNFVIQNMALVEVGARPNPPVAPTPPTEDPRIARLRALVAEMAEVLK